MQLNYKLQNLFGIRAKIVYHKEFDNLTAKQVIVFAVGSNE